ncbi:MAG: hypothetical protein SGPRY_011298 [Prymnesium sp.]
MASNTIVINAAEDPLNTANGSGLYIKPIKQGAQGNVLHYDPTSGEVVTFDPVLNNYYDALTTDSAIASALASYSTTAETDAARQLVLNDYYNAFTTDSAIASALAPYSTTAETDAARLAALNNYYDALTTDSAISTAISAYSTQLQQRVYAKEAETHSFRVTPGADDLTVIHTTHMPSAIVFENDENNNSASITSNNSGWLRVSSDSTLVLAHNKAARLRVLDTYAQSVVDMLCTNISYSGSLTQTSDARVKRDISSADLEDAYERVNQLPVRLYVYNDAETADTKWGFVAQEVQNVCAEAVSVMPGDCDAAGHLITDDNDSPVAFSDKHVVTNDRLYHMLFAAFQHSQLLILDLQARVQLLEAS